MITKIKRLKNIGKFYDFSRQANALDWHRNTFIFALMSRFCDDLSPPKRSR